MLIMRLIPLIKFYLGLVIIAPMKHPIPSRTRQLSMVAPMVLQLKLWESRSSPILGRILYLSYSKNHHIKYAFRPALQLYVILWPTEASLLSEYWLCLNTKLV
jgi:hypothetical protein